MKQEMSAGGVVVYRSAKNWQVLLIKDMNEAWTFPKGLIEKDEAPAKAAEREIVEEVGLTNLTRRGSLAPIEYFYRRPGLIHKKVHYFLFRSSKRQTPVWQKEEGITAAKWVDLNRAAKLIGYPKTNAPLLKAVQKQLAHGC